MPALSFFWLVGPRFCQFYLLQELTLRLCVSSTLSHTLLIPFCLMPPCMVLFLTANRKGPFLCSTKGMAPSHALLILHIRSSQFWATKTTLVCKCKKTLCWRCCIQDYPWRWWVTHQDISRDLFSSFLRTYQLGGFSWEAMSLTVTHKCWTRDPALGRNVHSCNSHYFLARNWTDSSTKSGIAIHWAHSNLGRVFFVVFINSFPLPSVFIIYYLFLKLFYCSVVVLES